MSGSPGGDPYHFGAFRVVGRCIVVHIGYFSICKISSTCTFQICTILLLVARSMSSVWSHVKRRTSLFTHSTLTNVSFQRCILIVDRRRCIPTGSLYSRLVT